MRLFVYVVRTKMASIRPRVSAAPVPPDESVLGQLQTLESEMASIYNANTGDLMGNGLDLQAFVNTTTNKGVIVTATSTRGTQAIGERVVQSGDVLLEEDVYGGGVVNSKVVPVICHQKQVIATGNWTTTPGTCYRNEYLPLPTGALVQNEVAQNLTSPAVYSKAYQGATGVLLSGGDVPGTSPSNNQTLMSIQGTGNTGGTPARGAAGSIELASYGGWSASNQQGHIDFFACANGQTLAQAKLVPPQLSIYQNGYSQFSNNAASTTSGLTNNHTGVGTSGCVENYLQAGGTSASTGPTQNNSTIYSLQIAGTGTVGNTSNRNAGALFVTASGNWSTLASRPSSMNITAGIDESNTQPPSSITLTSKKSATAPNLIYLETSWLQVLPLTGFQTLGGITTNSDIPQLVTGGTTTAYLGGHVVLVSGAGATTLSNGGFTLQTSNFGSVPPATALVLPPGWTVTVANKSSGTVTNQLTSPSTSLTTGTWGTYVASGGVWVAMAGGTIPT